ncbi:MAG TPA: hypothetical protein VJ570_11425 [Holophagaceae bacterium]|nr:hypothetical protein [Holophagaceae bacterium]
MACTLKALLRFGAPLLVALGLACGGGSGSGSGAVAPSSKGLSYVNPTGSGWRLMKDAASTPQRLVLTLVGPTGEYGRGVGFNLRTDGSVAFGKLDGEYLQDVGVFRLGNMTGPISLFGRTVVNDVYASGGGIKEDGKMLTVGAFQKDRRWPAVPLDQPLMRIAIDFEATTTGDLPKGAMIPLQVVRARSIPSYIGDTPGTPGFSLGSVVTNYRIDEIHVAVGTLTTN